MEWMKKAGIFLSSMGLILYFPPIESLLVEKLNQFGHYCGLVAAAAGLAILVSHMAYQAGKQCHENQISLSRYFFGPSMDNDKFE